MHHFISIAFSLLAIIGMHVSVQSPGRRFERSINRYPRSSVLPCFPNCMSVSNGMDWGYWRFTDRCPSRTYAAGFSLKVEYLSSGIWDDNTALNGIRLHCVSSESSSLNPHEHYYSIQSDVGSWGQWTDIKWCPSGFLKAFQLRVEPSQGVDDDTAVNNIRFRCSDGSYLMGGGTSWGSWGDWSEMCERRGICSIVTRVEEPQGWGDDTALNDVKMECCE
ncbi:vitelline membrane outer layer protein 1-like [Chanodichthys erythropterus]|uniref:vitelline membrane outer layer protein 1-like n=1 Tax=Chanodichthys erythropterus TaxID=933992 RepID=UPI00351F73EC